VPGILQPLRAIVPGLKAEPGYLIITPDPEELAFLVGLAGMAASPVIIKLHEIGQVLAAPAAKRFSALAAAINSVREANLQDGFLGLLRSFLDAQWKGVEIQDGISIVHQPTGRNMAVAKDHVAAGVPGRVIANEADQMKPVGVAVIVPIHDFHLPEVDAFTASIDVRCRLVIKPKLGFQ